MCVLMFNVFTDRVYNYYVLIGWAELLVHATPRIFLHPNPHLISHLVTLCVMSIGLYLSGHFKTALTARLSGPLISSEAAELQTHSTPIVQSWMSEFSKFSTSFLYLF